MLHNIYIDGSFLNNNSGIGIYDETNNKELFFKVNGLISSIEAEKEALKYALEYVKKENIKKFNILTDCKYISEKFKKILKNNKYFNDLKWIPRELNYIADKLANQGRLTKDINLIKEKLEDNIYFRNDKNIYNFYLKNNFLFKEEHFIDLTLSKKNIKLKISQIDFDNILLDIKNIYNLESKIELLRTLSSKHKEDLIVDCIENNILLEDLIDSNFIKENNIFMFAFSILKKEERSKNFNYLIKKYNFSKQINKNNINNLFNKLNKEIS